MTREQSIDQAVKQTLGAWAITVNPDTLIRRWEQALGSGEDYDGLADSIVPIIKANFYVDQDEAVQRISMSLVALHGGVPG